jgi:hypothetical protein
MRIIPQRVAVRRSSSSDAPAIVWAVNALIDTARGIWRVDSRS